MPEHVHLLLSEPHRSTMAVALQMLKQITARELLPKGSPPLSPYAVPEFEGEPPAPGGALSLSPLLGDKVGSRPPAPFWQARYYDFNVHTEKKRVEKLRYIHRNPVRRGLVQNPEDWPWCSFLRRQVWGAPGVSC